MTAASRSAGRTLLALLPVVLASSSCDDQTLNVKGATSRVIGETVTLALLSDDPSFNGDLSLRPADGALLSGTALLTSKKDERTLSFVVPPGTAQGPAVALAGRTGGGSYEVPLHVNRLALTLDDKGTVEGWPLAPATVTRSSFQGGTAGGLISLAPSGGELALAAGDQVRLIMLGPEIKDLGAGIQQTKIAAVAAAGGGKVLCATDQQLILFRFAKGQQTMQDAISFKDVRAVAVSAGGELAAVLFACSPTNACVEQITLQPTFAEVATSRQQLDAGQTAAVLAVTRDGRGIIAADGTGIHGVYYAAPAPASPRKSKIDWSWDQVPFTGQPVNSDRAPAVVNGQAVDLFVVAEQSKKAIFRLAFDATAGNDLRMLPALTMEEVPVRVSYGRRTQLFIATAKSLFMVDTGLQSPVIAPVAGVAPASSIVSLAVQP